MFWDNFARLCLESGEFPNVVAAKCGVTSSGTVSAWKNKGVIPRQKFLNAIAAHFDVTVDYLLSDIKTPATDRDGLSEMQMELINLVADLSDAEVAVLVKTAEALIEARTLRDGQ